MSSFITNLPPVPETDYSDYTLTYKPDTNQYRITFFDDLVSNELRYSNLYYGNCVVYTLNADDDEWNYQGSYLANTKRDFFCDGDLHGRRQLIGSTVTIYDSDGSVYCYGVSVPYRNGIPLIGGSLSGSDIVSYFGDLWSVIPLLVSAVVVPVAFRKAWEFFRGLIRGA
ncbi:MAG: hypothetical protein IJ305_04330 [Oscillospiraceae bacterium]|nr:hypothetical protein [Oscillospiraceae bacterium]